MCVGGGGGSENVPSSMVNSTEHGAFYFKKKKNQFGKNWQHFEQLDHTLSDHAEKLPHLLSHVFMLAKETCMVQIFSR